MLGFLIGTACLIGLVRVLRGGGCHGGWGARRAFYGGYGGHCGGARWDGGGYGHGPWEGGGFDRGHGGPFRTSGRGPWWARGGGYGMASFMLRRLFEALDTTPGQEKAITAAVNELREEAAKHRGEARKSREDIARAMRSPSFDEAAIGELFARHDAALEALRKAGVGAMAKIHEVLDEAQRARLADLIERGPGGFAGYGAEI